MDRIYHLTQHMIEFYQGQPKRIQHFIKVHSFAKLIGQKEGLDQGTMLVLEAAALVHDIGIRPAEEKYGRWDGKLQEQEGPMPAREMLRKIGFEEGDVERICYLVAHHHTYTGVDGMDYRILLEADFLVNLYESSSPKKAVDEALEHIFRTEAGSRILKTMFFESKDCADAP